MIHMVQLHLPRLGRDFNGGGSSQTPIGSECLQLIGLSRFRNVNWLTNVTNDPCVDVSDLAFACASLRQYASADTHVEYDFAKEAAGIKIRPCNWRMFGRRTLQQSDDALASERQAYS